MHDTACWISGAWCIAISGSAFPLGLAWLVRSATNAPIPSRFDLQFEYGEFSILSKYACIIFVTGELKNAHDFSVNNYESNISRHANFRHIWIRFDRNVVFDIKILLGKLWSVPLHNLNFIGQFGQTWRYYHFFQNVINVNFSFSLSHARIRSRIYISNIMYES